MSFTDSGWVLEGLSSRAATFEVGMAVGGGRFSLDIKDAIGIKRKLNYDGVSIGAGFGANLDNLSEGLSREALQVIARQQAPSRFILNVIMPIFRGAINSMEDLPASKSRIYLNGNFFGSTPPLTWDGDFVGKSIAMWSIGYGVGVGVSGSLIFFFSDQGRSFVAGQFGIPFALHSARAIAFVTGMQIAQMGVEFLSTRCIQR